MNRVYLLYCVSGLVSLGYQVAWFRIYVDRFGSTNLTFALVVTNFIAGLGVGALASRPVADRLASMLKINDRLRLYGVVELLVAASVLLTVLTGLIPSDAWGSFPYVEHGNLHVQTPFYQLSQLALAALCVFVPCFFMGVTFPLLCHAFAADGRFPSALYAWNTLGACSGVLVCEFLLLPWVGHNLTLWIMMAVNLLIGAIFLAVGRAPDAANDLSTAVPGAALPAGKRRRRAPAAFLGVLLTCAVLSGYLSGALEADMFKRIAFLGNDSPAAMSFISFWAIAAIFLASWAVRGLQALKLVHIKVAFFLALASYATAWQLAYPIREWFIDRAYAPALESVAKQQYPPSFVRTEFPASLAQVLLFVGIFVFPAYLMISLLLPYVCNRLQSDRRHLGVAYGLNTLAFCLGMIAFTWLAPRVNIFYSMKLMMVTLAIGAVFLLLISEHRRLAAWKPAMAIAALVAACLLTPADFDPSYFLKSHPAALYPVRAMKSNAAHTTYVVADPQGDRLCFDSYSMSGTSQASQVYMRLMAHFPLLAHPQPERTLLICFGVGNTASAIAAHQTVKHIDIVDLNDKVIETAPEFARYNNRVYLDPRVRLIHDDGRNFLGATTNTYDLITSEPPPPMLAGVYRLYSKEYYETALAHLTPAGMMSQWLPVYQMPPEAVDLAVATFVGVFPHALLFTGHGTEFVLVGSRSPIDLRRIEERFDEQPSVVADLHRIDVRRPLQLVARVVKGERTLSEEFGGRPMISDQHNDLTFLFLKPLEPGIISYNPLDMLSDIGAERLEMHDELRAVVTHLGRLRYTVGFPYESLATVRPDEAPGVALADVDWRLVQWIWERRGQLQEAGRSGDRRAARAKKDQAINLLHRALRMASEQPELLLHLAATHADAGRHEDAIDVVRRFQQIEPNDPLGHFGQGVSLLALRRYDQAISALQRAVRLAPDHALAHLHLGDALSELRRTTEAIRHYRETLRIQPNSFRAHNNLGIALLETGQPHAAIDHFRDAIRLNPNDDTARRNLARAESKLNAAGQN